MKILLHGRSVYIDKQDLHLLSLYPWRVVKGGCGGKYEYVGYRSRRKPNRGKRYWLHRLILQTKKLVDHKNRNGLDNRRRNLREATYQQNSWNHKVYGHNTSGYSGVVRFRDKWRAEICADGRQIYLGVFTSKRKAHQVRQKVARELRGQFA